MQFHRLGQNIFVDRRVFVGSLFQCGIGFDRIDLGLRRGDLILCGKLNFFFSASAVFLSFFASFASALRRLPTSHLHFADEAFPLEHLKWPQ